MTDTESRAAYLYLNLQLEDETREKGLTKLSFEAIIRSVLRETNSQNRMAREKIKEEVRKVLSSHTSVNVDLYTDHALQRMTKNYIRYWPKDDTFCLSFEETLRLSKELARLDSERQELKRQIKESFQRNAGDDYRLIEDAIEALCQRVERIIEKYLSTRGEKFATAVTTNKAPGLAVDDLKTIITNDFLENPLSNIGSVDLFRLISDAILDLFRDPTPITSGYLRSISDTYTLMAFLRETPDVQSCVKKMFSNGEIWLDTSIVLPLFAEQLLDDLDKRQYSNMILAAQNVGMKFYVSKGIVEEVNGHMNRSLACSRTTGNTWHGDVPFLFSVYVLSGRQISAFSSWIENFKGEMRPDDDLAEYIKENFNIEAGSLEKEAESASLALRGAVQEVWHESHEFRKKRKGYEIDELVIGKLIRHDVENYLGVIGRRAANASSPLGYSAWWLTLDSTAHKLSDLLKSRISERPPSTPVMSLDFLANYMTFGPLRKLKTKGDFKLPIFTDKNFVNYIPMELLEIAKKVREQAGDLPEIAVRRRVRDELDAAKRRIGKHVEGGAPAMKERIEAAFEGRELEDEIITNR